MDNVPYLIPSLIQLDSPDAVWEWQLAPDALFLSRGACHALGLHEDNIPRTMQAFMQYIPEDCHTSLLELRENALNGATGPEMEAVYPFDSLLINERLLVVARNAEGRAERVVGRYKISDGQYQPPLPNSTGDPDTGYWGWSATQNQVRLDGRCAVLLGFAEAQPLVFGLEEISQRLHPDEGKGFERRYQLTVEHQQFGDIFEDCLRIRLESGNYARFSVRGSVLERNDNGIAQEITGTVQKVGVFQTDVASQAQDTGRLLLAINATGDGIWDWDAQTNEVYYSPR